MQLLHTMLHVVSRSGSHLIRYEQQLTEVRRLAHEGLEATLCLIEPGKKNRDEPQRPLPDPTQKWIGTSRPFSFDPDLEPSPQNLHRGEASGPPKSVGWLRHLAGGGLRSSGMPHEGYADPVSE